jgi:DNA-damage-inducible protein J
MSDQTRLNWVAPRVRIAIEMALPLDPLVPNAETIAAMQEARQAGLPRFASIDALIADLNADE